MDTDVTGQGPPNVRRVFYREILPGDRLKAAALSNIAPTGGGARDFRFNARRFDPILKKMFLRQTATPSGLEVRVATVYWGRRNQPKHADLEYWPPTNARPAEGRIARISSVDAFANPPQTDEPVFALFSQHRDGKVWVRYATLSGLQQGNQTIAEQIRVCYASKRGERAVVGYIDFDEGKAYCHE